ncbi:MAG: hypothetical protein LBL00_02040 [Endomicrobium sp.]|jgi:hypothetical protein|nr:hypothetical protein [Endomicrobium sp.]
MNNDKKKLKPQTIRLKQKKFLCLVKTALNEINQEIENPQKHKKDNMHYMKEEVEKMKEARSTMIFQPTYPLHIVDHWHPKDKLGDILLNLYYMYLDLE